MKRTFAKRSLQALVAVFFLVGGLFLTNSANAQQVGTTLTVDGYNWVPVPQAMTLLEGQIINLNNQIGNVFVVGTQQWQDAMRRVIFYKGVYTRLDAGSPVPDAIVATYTLLANPNLAGSGDDSVTFTTQQVYQIGEDVKELLSL